MTARARAPFESTGGRQPASDRRRRAATLKVKTRAPRHPPRRFHTTTHTLNEHSPATSSRPTRTPRVRAHRHALAALANLAQSQPTQNKKNLHRDLRTRPSGPPDDPARIPRGVPRPELSKYGSGRAQGGSIKCGRRRSSAGLLFRFFQQHPPELPSKSRPRACAADPPDAAPNTLLCSSAAALPLLRVAGARVGRKSRRDGAAPKDSCSSKVGTAPWLCVVRSACVAPRPSRAVPPRGRPNPDLSWGPGTASARVDSSGVLVVAAARAGAGAAHRDGARRFELAPRRSPAPLQLTRHSSQPPPPAFQKPTTSNDTGAPA